MARMIFPNKLHRLPCHPSRQNLTRLILTFILCTVSYLIGIQLHHSNHPAAASRVTRTRIEIPLGNNSSLPVMSREPPSLDFLSHHMPRRFSPPTARSHLDTLNKSPVQKRIRFPLCGPEFVDYTPCEDMQRSLRFDREMFVYRERHCPGEGEKLQCRIPAPSGYREPLRWPASRDAAWFSNVPHKELVVEKRVQNWVTFKDDQFTFPGGGTMFPKGADEYIDRIGEIIDLEGGSIRTALDTGCGVASWGAYLLGRNILTMSFAPRDTHEAQVQFALERGVPAMIGILASNRLPYPSRAFDVAHCSRCLIPWSKYEGLYLIEVDRVLRPGGYWILSGPPINWRKQWSGWNRTQMDLQQEQDSIEKLAKSICWKKLREKDDIAIWQKATNHIHCKISRKVYKFPPFCPPQDPDRAWYTKMEPCLTALPEATELRDTAGGRLPKWPERLSATPARITNGTLEGITGDTFTSDAKLWRRRVSHYKSLDRQLAEKGRYRNLLDMNAYLGGFAAAFTDDPVWVMNIVPVDAQVNTLGVIYDRGLIGTYQDWCEAMSTYPRTYDFIHADKVFTLYNNQDRCRMEDILLEIDRILRPMGSIIFRDDVDVIVKVKSVLDAMEYETRIADHENGPFVREKILLASRLHRTVAS